MFLPFKWNRNNHSCTAQKRELNGPILLEYIKKVTFTSPTGNAISFDENGNVISGYEILNFQSLGVQQYNLKTIGAWKPSSDGGSGLKLINSTLQFGIHENDSVIVKPPSSKCGVCQPGQFLLSLPSSCIPCLGRNYSNSSYARSCSNCSAFGDY